MHSTAKQQQRQGAAVADAASTLTRQPSALSTAQLERLQWDTVASGALVLRDRHLSLQLLTKVGEHIATLSELELHDAAAELDTYLRDRRVELRGELPGSDLPAALRQRRLVRLVEAVRGGHH